MVMFSIGNLSSLALTWHLRHMLVVFRSMDSSWLRMGKWTMCLRTCVAVTSWTAVSPHFVRERAKLSGNAFSLVCCSTRWRTLPCGFQTKRSRNAAPLDDKISLHAQRREQENKMTTLQEVRYCMNGIKLSLCIGKPGSDSSSEIIS